MAVVSSAANLLAQLEEDDEALRLNALQSLNNVVHEFWFQIASSIASVEAFYEDETFTHRELAALVASKVSSGVPSRTSPTCLDIPGPIQNL
jgi:26S proteasome regulatory subunit N2